MSSSNPKASALSAITTLFSNVNADLTIRHNRKMMHSITQLREDGIKIHAESAKRITTVIEDTEAWLSDGNDARKAIFTKEYDIIEQLIAPYIPSISQDETSST